MTMTDYERRYHQVLDADQLASHLNYYGSHHPGHRAISGMTLDELRAAHAGAHKNDGTPLHGHPLEGGES